MEKETDAPVQQPTQLSMEDFQRQIGMMVTQLMLANKEIERLNKEIEQLKIPKIHEVKK